MYHTGRVRFGKIIGIAPNGRDEQGMMKVVLPPTPPPPFPSHLPHTSSNVPQRRPALARSLAVPCWNDRHAQPVRNTYHLPAP